MGKPQSSEHITDTTPATRLRSRTGSMSNSSHTADKNVKSPSFSNINLDVVLPGTRPSAFTKRRNSVPVSFINTVSDADSQKSDSSNETEEDVWFPMDQQNTRRPNNIGIDFSELQEFIDEQRDENQALLEKNGPVDGLDYGYSFNNESGRANKDKYDAEEPVDEANSLTKYKSRNELSKAALKYIPKWLHYRPRMPRHLPHHYKRKHLSTRVKPLPLYSDGQESPDLSENKLSSDEQQALLGDHQVGFAEEKNKVEDDSFIERKHQPVEENQQQQPVLHTALELTDIPYRFSLFTSDKQDTIHSYDLPSLVKPGQSIESLFESRDPNHTWWLDCCCATDSEIKILAKTFGIHPLTSEDIRMSENREKVEFFKDYYFVCFHSFNADNESEDFLEPIYFYMLVFKTGFLTFYNSPVNHCINVRRRIRQLRDYVPLSSDWICYALIDDITDSFFPVIQAIDYETDAIEASVFVVRDMDFSTMLNRIGLSRNKVMTLLRLLGSKADVLRMLSKRCHDYAPIHTNGESPSIMQNANSANTQRIEASVPISGLNTVNNSTSIFNMQNDNTYTHGSSSTEMPPSTGPNLASFANNLASLGNEDRSQLQPPVIGQPRSDISLYLGDIQDHIITMHQNLTSYEKILARSYTNYLAQLQVESFNSNNKVTDMLSKVTLIGTVLVPLNVVTGLFGMNVKIPGQDGPNLGWFFGIVGVLVLTVVLGVCFANWWVNRINQSISQMNGRPDGQNDDSRTILSRFIHNSMNIGRNNRNRDTGQSDNDARSNVRSIYSFNN